MKKSIIEMILGFIRQIKRNRRWRNTVTCIAALVVFVTTYVMILPAITLEGAHPRLSAETVTGWAGDPMSVTVKAESPAGSGEKVVVITAEAVDAGLSEEYVFDSDEVTVIKDSMDQEILLHRTVREGEEGKEDRFEYWFALSAGQQTEFTLNLQDEIDVKEIMTSAGIVKNVRIDKDAEKASASDADKEETIAAAENEATASDAVKETEAAEATASSASKATPGSAEEDVDDDGKLADGMIVNDLETPDEDAGTEVTATLKLMVGMGNDFEEAVRDVERNAEKRGDASLEYRWRIALNIEKELSWEADGVSVTMFYNNDARIPEDARLFVAEIPQGSAEYNAYLESAKGAMGVDTATASNAASGMDEAQKLDVNYARFFDIRILDADGDEIEPEAQVIVKIDYDEAESITGDTDVQMVHFPKAGGTELVDAIIDGEDEELNGVAFNAGGFSVYGIVGTYTVDFHWEVNGQTFDFSIPGGGYASLEQVVELLGIATNKTAPAESNTADNAEPLMLSDTGISEATRNFVANVVNVEFSTPELVSVTRMENSATVGDIKKALGLECKYSAELTEAQIAEINAQTVKAGDWALISIQPFTSEEILTVSMKDGGSFTIKVTDALNIDPEYLVGQEIVIFDKTENRALTSEWSNPSWGSGSSAGSRTQFNSVAYAGEGISSPENAHWMVEKNGNSYYLKSNDGKYLYIDTRNVKLVDTQNQATPLSIEKWSDSSYTITSQVGQYNNPYLIYADNSSQYDGFFSSSGASTYGEVRRYLGIDYAVSMPDRVGDWLLYFDDDFDEITIHVGETITLRPYDKWEWKEGSTDVQRAHWNIGGKDESFWNQIDSGDDNGAHRTGWDDGGTGDNSAVFHWDAYVKKDTELVTHYWSVQGRATQLGDYTLTNTKNGKKITVHVVEGDPKPIPDTVSDTVDIKVNLFDYDKGFILDPADNTNLDTNNNNKNDSTNLMGGGTGSGGNRFYFLSSGSTDAVNGWNKYTQGAANPGIVNTALGPDGYPELNHSTNYASLKYLFDTSEGARSWHGGNNDGMIAYPNVNGMFQQDEKGYYYYNSNTNYFYYNPETGDSELYEHTYTQASSEEKGSLVNDKPIGFFPFHEYDATHNLHVNQNSNLNHHLGMSIDIPFRMNEEKLDEYGKPIKFEFTGDDDLWVFAEWTDDQGNKQSKLLLDIGGIHQPVYGYIDFTNDNSSNYGSLGLESNRNYNLKVFYLERGGCDSNLAIRFNLPLTHIVDIRLTKVDEQTGESHPLSGARFELYKDSSCNEKIREETSDEHGQVMFKGVSAGTYYMKEVEPPAGYKRTKHIFKVEVIRDHPEMGEFSPLITKIDGTVAPDDYSYKLNNTPNELTVRKVWVKTQTSDQTPVYFKLYKKNSTEGSPDTEITDKPGYVSGKGYLLQANDQDQDPENDWKVIFKPIEDGQYYVVEETPEGFFTQYAANDKKAVDDAKAAWTDVDGMLTILNQPDIGDLEIVKVDKNTKKPLAHAKFEIRRIKDTLGASGIEYDGPVIAQVETDVQGEAEFSGIVRGYYEIKETKLPDGYVATGDDRFYIKVDRAVIYLLKKEDGKDPKEWDDTQTVVGNVTFTAATVTAAASAQVENTPGVELPQSGGPGTLLYTLGGLALVSASALMYGFRQRRRERRLN